MENQTGEIGSKNDAIQALALARRLWISTPIWLRPIIHSFCTDSQTTGGWSKHSEEEYETFFNNRPRVAGGRTGGKTGGRACVCHVLMSRIKKKKKKKKKKTKKNNIFKKSCFKEEWSGGNDFVLQLLRRSIQLLFIDQLTYELTTGSLARKISRL